MTQTDSADQERVIWEGRAGWMDHAVLFVFLSVALVRAIVAGRAGDWTTVTLYAFTIAGFLGIAAWFHYGRFYRLTSVRVLIKSGWSDRVLHEMPLRDITDISIRYDLLNRWFDLGTVELASRSSEECCTIRGIPYPEDVKARLERWISAQRNPWEKRSAHGAADHVEG
ncbi:hypothetical protein YTPLAS18_37740 [Nitrospira sp.]|nr:hypothetical protein YTPLAS18_37740 [Nitrospira sp.]